MITIWYTSLLFWCFLTATDPLFSLVFFTKKDIKRNKSCCSYILPLLSESFDKMAWFVSELCSFTFHQIQYSFNLSCSWIWIHIPLVHLCIKAQQLKSLEKSILSWKYHILNMITFMSYCMQQIQPKTTYLEFHSSFQWCIYIFFVGNSTLLSASSLYPSDLFIFLSTSLLVSIFLHLAQPLSIYFSLYLPYIKKTMYILSLCLSSRIKFAENSLLWTNKQRNENITSLSSTIQQHCHKFHSIPNINSQESSFEDWFAFKYTATQVDSHDVDVHFQQ